LSNCNYLFLFLLEALVSYEERALHLLARVRPSIADSRQSLTDAATGMNAAREKGDAMG
jgi:hypothetical protein